MANKYVELRDRQQQEFDSFPCFFAFNAEQFEEGMRELGVHCTSEIYRGVGGMFYRRTDAEKLHEMMIRHETELREAYQDDDFLYSAFRYELANHEYCITMEAEETLDALGIEQEELQTDERMKRIFRQARADYLKAACV